MSHDAPVDGEAFAFEIQFPPELKVSCSCDMCCHIALARLVCGVCPLPRVLFAVCSENPFSESHEAREDGVGGG